MGNNFQWHTDTDFDPPPDPENSTQQRRSWEIIGFWLVTAVIIILLISGWFIGQRQLAQVDGALQSELQTLLDVQHKAFLAGDGDLFFTTLSPDADWQAAQLLPFNQAPQHNGYTVTRVETNQEIVWANATWKDGRETYQRLLFFEDRNSRYRQIPTDPEYWGKLERRRTEWGELYHYEIDDDWVPSITEFVAELCRKVCDPFTLLLTDDFVQTAVPGQVTMPSPRLIGLDEQGNPSPLFWDLLRERLEDHLMPATIRFAIPPPRTAPCCWTLNYQNAAAEFMRLNPHVQVELVVLDAPPDDLSALAAQVDGAAIPPTVDMVAAGDVYDLTDFANSDPDFYASDFYEHVWQGTLWRDRMWFMPLAAEFNLIYYDKQAFALAGVPEPNLFWQWADMDKSAPAVLASQPEQSFLTWQLLDISRDALFAHAYSLADSCLETAVPPCLNPLQFHHISDTFNWYKELVLQDQMPNLTQQSDSERMYVMNNYQSAQRHALFWVDGPIAFESSQLLDPVGVVPFPGVESMEGITPLWVDGAFISAQSKHPYATWQWLTFLSYQSPDKSYRLVPARSSVAAETKFWQNLPRPLVDPMRTAYTFSRPVTLPEKRFFDWSYLAQFVSDTGTPQNTVPQPPSIKWFGEKEDK